MKENQRYNKRTESVRKEYKKQEGFNMRKNLGAKAYTYPQPVFILAAYGEDGTPNAMNAACLAFFLLTAVIVFLLTYPF